MMIIKIIGVILVMVSASLIGCGFAECMASRERELLNLADAIELMINELEYSLEPIKTLFFKVTPFTKGMVNDLFEDISQNVNDGFSAGDAWVKSLEKTAPLMSLKKADCELLKSCSDVFYAYEADRQKLQLKGLKEKIMNIASMAGQSKQKNSKLVRMLGVYGGVLICAILF